MSNLVYEKVTSYIIESLQNNIAPWRKSWAPRGIRPQNLITNKPYRGINTLTTALTGESFFLTYKQAQENDCQVRKGSKGIPVVFWNFKDDEKTDKTLCFVKYYTIFPISCIDLSKPMQDKIDSIIPKGNEHKKIDLCESFIQKTNAIIKHGSDKAYYIPSLDSIHLPDACQFDSIENYYVAAFHELTHWTGHDTRLKRDGIINTHNFGDPVYSKEELVAELGAAFLCADFGIENTIESSAAYISGWLKALKNDKKLIVEASQKAQKAADFLQKREVKND